MSIATLTRARTELAVRRVTTPRRWQVCEPRRIRVVMVVLVLERLDDAADLLDCRIVGSLRDVARQLRRASRHQTVTAVAGRRLARGRVPARTIVIPFG